MQLGKTANGHSAAAQASDKGLRVSFWVCICTKMRPLVMTCTRTSNRLSLNSWLRGRAPAVPTIAEQPQVSCSTNWSSNDLQTLAIARPSQPCYLLGALQMSFLSNFFGHQELAHADMMRGSTNCKSKSIGASKQSI